MASATEATNGTEPANGVSLTNGVTTLSAKYQLGPITKVTKKQHLAAAATLAEAFEFDDVARYVIDMPDSDHWSRERKWKLHCDIMNYITVGEPIFTSSPRPQHHLNYDSTSYHRPSLR